MHGISISGAPIPHSIRLVSAKRDLNSNKILDSCDLIFEKGSVLPLKSLTEYSTSKILRKGENGTLDITIVEGESEIPDRNLYICKLGINGNDLPYDLPENTPIELKIDYSESREISITAYIPLIDLIVNARETQKDEVLSKSELSDQLETQRKRIAEIQDITSSEESDEIENIYESAESSLISPDADNDDIRKASNQIKELKNALDNLENSKTDEKIKSDFYKHAQQTQETINEFAEEEKKPEYNEKLELLKIEGEKALNQNNKIHLNQINSLIENLDSEIRWSNLDFLIQVLHYYIQKGEEVGFSNKDEANYYVNKSFNGY